MRSYPLSGYDLHGYNPSVRRFFLFAVPLFVGMALFSLLYNLYLVRLGYQEDFIGQLSGLFPLASGLFAIPTGYLSDRYGRKPFLYATSILLGCSQIALCLVTSSFWLLVSCFVGGIASAFIFVNFIPFLAENAAREQRGQAISIWMGIQVVTRMVVSLGGGLLPDAMTYITGISTTLPEPFRYTLLFGAACSFASILPLRGIETKPKEAELAEADNKEAGPPPWKYLLTFSSISLFRGLSMGFAFPFLNIFFESDLDASTALIGTIFFLSQVVGLPATLASPILARFFGPRRVIVCVRLVGAAAGAALGFQTSIPFAVALFLIASGSGSLTTPMEMTFATHTLPRAYWGRLQSVRVTGFQIPSGLASIWAGSLILQHGYWIGFALAGAASFISALLFYLAFGIRRRDESGLPVEAA